MICSTHLLGCMHVNLPTMIFFFTSPALHAPSAVLESPFLLLMAKTSANLHSRCFFNFPMSFPTGRCDAQRPDHSCLHNDNLQRAPSPPGFPTHVLLSLFVVSKPPVAFEAPMTSPMCQYTPPKRACTCSNYNAKGKGHLVHDRGRAPAIMPAPSSTGYIAPKHLIRPQTSSSALLPPNSASRPRSTGTGSCNSIYDKDASKDKSGDDDDDKNMVFVRTPSTSNDRDGGQLASVEIFNLAGSNLAKDLSAFLNINTPQRNTPTTTRADQYSHGEYFSRSSIYGLTTAMRLTASLSHLRTILLIYRDYDYCSRSKQEHPP